MLATIRDLLPTYRDLLPTYMTLVRAQRGALQALVKQQRGALDIDGAVMGIIVALLVLLFLPVFISNGVTALTTTGIGSITGGTSVVSVVILIVLVGAAVASLAAFGIYRMRGMK